MTGLKHMIGTNWWLGWLVICYRFWYQRHTTKYIACPITTELNDNDNVTDHRHVHIFSIYDGMQLNMVYDKIEPKVTHRQTNIQPHIHNAHTICSPIYTDIFPFIFIKKPFHSHFGRHDEKSSNRDSHVSDVTFAFRLGLMSLIKNH